jgi:hypothetical protein
LISVAQDPKVEKKKKRQKEDHNVVDTATYSVERKVDSLYLEQKALNAKLDSLLLEKQRK